jgi:hypothetical protein
LFSLSFGFFVMLSGVYVTFIIDSQGNHHYFDIPKQPYWGFKKNNPEFCLIYEFFWLTNSKLLFCWYGNIWVLDSGWVKALWDEFLHYTC